MEEQQPSAENNLWESLLRESSASKARVPPGVLLFLGENTCGKRELLEKFCDGVKEENKFEVSDMLSYNYFSASDPDDNEKEVEGSHVGVWSVSAKAIEAGIDVIQSIVLKGRTVKSKSRIMFLIGIDCTIKTDQIIDSFLKWLGCVHKLALSLQTQEVKGDERLVDLLANIDAQLCAVVCKADYIQSGDIGVMKAFKSLQGSLRSICLEHGAALIYTSVTTDLNCVKLQKYILQSLYNEEMKINMSVEIEEGISNAFVPTALDSPERIFASTGINFSDVIAKYNETTPISIFETMNLNDCSEIGKVNTSDNAIQDIEQSLENEQDWLSRLKKFVALAEATSTDIGAGVNSSANYSKPVSRSGSDNALSAAMGRNSLDDKATPGDIGTEKKKAVPTRRSARNAANTGTGDPTDFFKNLLVEAKPKK